MTSDIEFRKALDFVYSDRCDLSTPQGKAIRIDVTEDSQILSRGSAANIRGSSDYVPIEATRGGIELERFIKYSNISMADCDSLWREAQLKYLSQAKGNLTILLSERGSHSFFKMHELPIILKNENLITLNHVEKKQFEIALLNDRELGKDQAHERIIGFLSGQKGIEQLVGKERRPMSDSMAITQATRIHTSAETERIQASLTEARNRVIYDAAVLNALEARVRVMGWRANTPVNMVKLYFERREIRREIGKSFDNLYDEISNEKEYRQKNQSKAQVKEIRKTADDLLFSEKRKLTMSDSALARQIDRIIEHDINFERNKEVHSIKSLELSEDVKQGQGRKRN